MILLDSNVISELMLREPHPAVLGFLRRQATESLFTAAICEAELRYGIARLPPGRRRDGIASALDRFLAEAVGERILPFTSACANAYGAIRAERAAAGRPIAALDTR